jgi:cystathionine gamma-synthase
MRFETIAVHAGGEADEVTGAVAPPIHLSTTFARDAESELISEFAYVREGNPTQSRLEAALSRLEGGSEALVFGSGMAAGTALVQSLEPGTHLLLPDDSYYGFRLLADDFLAKWGLTSQRIAMQDLAAVRGALRERSVIWGESPSNPLMKISDLEGLSALARERGALMVVDGTFAPPPLQFPLTLGADVVLHATTKYHGGHSDVQGGALIFRERGELFEKVLHTRHITGGVASPFNSWLVLRGLRTLAARLRVHCENASAVAEFLAAHPRVSAVHYPGLGSHPGHAVAARQMSAFGGMLSFQLKEGRDAALDVVRRVRIFVRATSLGGVESLIEHRATSEGPSSTAPADLLRLSIGLEHPADLIDDLRAALG